MTPGGAPDVTVVVPARNAERWIVACLRAVEVNRPSEVILVDGGSTDATVRLARPYVDRVLDDGGTGVAGARQMGVQAATTRWIAFVDADMVLAPDALERMINEAHARGLAGIQAGMASIGGGDYWSEQLALHHNSGRNRTWFGVSACLVLRSLMVDHPFDVRLRSGEDVDLRLRLEAAGVPVGVTADVVTMHRYAAGLAVARGQWSDDGAGLGRLVRAHGRSAVVAAALPFPAALWGAARGFWYRLAPWPYFVGFAFGNAVGLVRGLSDRRIAVRPGRRILVVAATVCVLGLLTAMVGLCVALLAGLVAAAVHAVEHGGAEAGLCAAGILATGVILEFDGPPGRRRWLRPGLALAAFVIVLSAARVGVVIGSAR